MKQGKLFNVRDRRKKGWFYLDNEYLNGYAKTFGAVGTAIYVSLCRHADNETQECFPSMELISEELNISRNTVAKYIKMFTDYHLIATERTKNNNGTWKNNTYFLLDKIEWMNHAQPLGMDNHAQLLSEPCTTIGHDHAQPLGNKETHINYTHIKETNTAHGAGNTTNALISLFKGINPSYQLFFARPPQRAAADRLLKLHDFEWWQRFFEAYPKALEDRFCPRATSPIKLEEKIGDIEHYGRSQKQKEVKKTNIAFS